MTKKGEWRVAGCGIIYENAGTGKTADDKTIVHLGAPAYAQIICEKHNEAIEKIKEEFEKHKQLNIPR